MFHFPLLSAAFALVLGVFPVHGDTPLVRAGDVVALIGGADLSSLSEQGDFERRIVTETAAAIRFRSLAWEGDTVWEQSRDLNFPPLEAQLEKVGATAVVVQLGKMEALAGMRGTAVVASADDGRPKFALALEQMLQRLGGDGKRRLVLVSPFPADPELDLSREANARIAAVVAEMRAVAQKRDLPFFDVFNFMLSLDTSAWRGAWEESGIHPSAAGNRLVAVLLADALLGRKWQREKLVERASARTALDESVGALVVQKNRLWFHYWRPQNWAFLNGDRTSQPSSRDHRDPSKRWFPEEIEKFMPMIEAKEREIATRVAGGAK